MSTRVLAYMLTGFMCAGSAVAVVALAGSPLAGAVLGVFVLAIPPSMLVLAVARKFTNRDGQDLQAKPTGPQLPGSKMFLALAALGVAGIAMIISSTALRNEGGLAAVGGWLIILAFACLTIVPVAGIIFLRIAPTLPVAVRSLTGPRRRLYRGMLRSLDGRLEGAAEALVAYEKDYPDDNRAPGVRSAVLVRQHRYEDALLQAEGAVDIRRTPEALITKAQCLALLGAYEEALAEAQVAFAMKPDLFAASHIPGAALVELRLLDEAISLLQGERRNRRTAASLFTLAEAYRLRGSKADSIKAYEQTVKLMPLNIIFRIVPNEGLWACALAKLGNLDKAEKRATATLRADPTDLLGLHARALIEMRRGDRDQLEEYLRRLLNVRPASAVEALIDPDFTPLLAEKRFRELLAWALGAQRQARERVLARSNSPA